MTKWRAISLPLVIALVSLFKGSAGAENERPSFVGKGIQETKISIPPKLNDDYDFVGVISIVSNTQALPFVLLRAWNQGNIDGMVDLWFVNHEEFTFVDTIRGDARSNAGSIAYKDDGSVAFFHVGRGGLWMIDGSTKEVKMVANGFGEISYFAIMSDGSLYLMVKSRKELWTSDWTKEGTVMIEAFEDSLKLIRKVTDGFVLQVRNRTVYYWDESDGSTNILQGIKIDDCLPGDVAAIEGANGSKGLIAANGLWSIGRHPPKLLTKDFGWITYLGIMKDEVLLSLYQGSSSFQITDGEELRPMNVPLDRYNPHGTGSGFFGPFANKAHYIFMGDSFLAIHDNREEDTAELAATITDPHRMSDFLPLLEENKVLARSTSKLWEFDAGTNDLRLLVDWDAKVYLEPKNDKRDRSWDKVFIFRDGSLLMPMRKTAVWGKDPSYSALEFWRIQLDANTEEYGKPTTASSSVAPLVVPLLVTTVLLVLFGSWMYRPNQFCKHIKFWDRSAEVSCLKRM